MMPRSQSERWELLELVGAYAAGEIEGEEAREVERLMLATEDNRRLVESYAQMLALLTALGEERPEAPETVINYAIRRAYVSAVLRRADSIVRGLAIDYLGALVHYLGLRPAQR
jgi:anti-sigma-K factor RskA